MTTLLHHEHAVKCDGCGATLLLPELDGRLCAMCHAEVMSDMMSEKEQIEELTRQRDRLLAACKETLAWADRECMPQGGKGDGPWEQIEDAIASTGADSVPE